MESFDVVTLRVFLAVARHGSIGAAARSEHIAASAASRRISDLEQDLGTVLIKRTPAGASLTAAGRVFSKHCETLLSSYAEVRTDLKRFAEGNAGELRIAAIPRAIDGTLPSFIAGFKRRNPSIHITLQEVYSRQAIRALREDMADLAMVYDSVNMRGFEVVPYKQDPVWIVGHKDHPLFTRFPTNSAVYYRDTFEYEHIAYHDGGVLDDLVAEARRKEKNSPRCALKMLRVNSLMRCVEAGLGLGVVGERDIEAHRKNPHISALPLADHWAHRNLVCVYSKGQAASPVVKRFLEYLLP